MLNTGQHGIHPPGALGVGFFIHSNASCFIGRSGDGITQYLKEAEIIRVQENDKPRSVSLKGKIFANLLEADACGMVPELLFVCCNPNQLGLFTEELTTYLENLADRGRFGSLDDIAREVPILLILPNGVLSEQTVQTFADQLNESILMDRLPCTNSAMIDAILARIVRGISLQAAGRRGSGVDTVYLLEKKGSLIFAGGGEYERNRIEEILTKCEYPFTHAKGVPGTRIEFDKAMISIVLNVGGLIHTVSSDGELIDLRMGDLCKDSSKKDFLNEITRAVFDVGCAVGAYPDNASYEEIWQGHREIILRFAGHVTSSLKTFRDELNVGLDSVKLFSNEEWILTPLARYAANAGMRKEEALFKSLGRQVQQSMARAIKARTRAGSQNGLMGNGMKLAAQRNIGIELFEAGADDVVLFGTMLDHDHLIKLEMAIHLPDEQITRCRLEMIRVPFPVCHEVESVAERLVGLRIERGVMNEIANRIGGSAGCSHIKEIATSMVYFMASHLVRKRAGMGPFDKEFATTPPEERFRLTKDLLQDSCLAFCQTTAQGLDERIGIRRVGEDHTCPIPLGDCEPSFGVLLKDRASRYQNKVYFRSRKGNEDFSITWNEFADKTFQIARNLISLNIKPGDRIGMISENRLEMYMFEMATMSIGAITVPIFAGYPPAQVGYVLRHSQPKCVVVSGVHQLQKLERDRHSTVERYYCMDSNSETVAWGAIDFAELLAEGGASQEDLDARINKVKPNDLCMIMYTSGTTGPPKGVKLTHLNLISQQKAMSLLWDISENDVFMSYLPWHHSFGGLFERYMSLYNGCELCLDDSRGRDTDRMIENWRVFNPTLFFSVPRVHEMLQTRCRDEEAIHDLVFGGNLRLVFTAGASLPAPIETMYRDNDIPVLEGWGLTETSPCVTVTRIEDNWRSGYVGFPIPGVTVRVNSDQEILVKGPNVMQGYLDDEDSTFRVIDEDGWFHTGDLGQFSKNGLRIFGRKDGAFKLTTGEKVHPQRVENILVNNSQFVNTAVIVGSGKNFVGALIYPDFAQLRVWAKQNNVTADILTDSPKVRELFAAELEQINQQIEVKYQRVLRAILADREPSLERGELTPSAKIVRQRVCDAYKHQLDALFDKGPPDYVIDISERQLQGA